MKSNLWPTLAILLVGLTSGWSARGFTTPADSPSTKPVQTEGIQELPTSVPLEKSTALDSPLGTLDWLVGDWEGGGKLGRIEFSCRFTKNNAFLIRSFRVIKGETEVVMSGMQLIGWDPAAKSIRSWTFDSDGGFGEDHWTQKEQFYTSRSKYTLPDGGIGAALNSMAYVDDETFVWQSIHREIDGELLPDVQKVVVRKISGTVADKSPSNTEGGK